MIPKIASQKVKISSALKTCDMSDIDWDIKYSSLDSNHHIDGLISQKPNPDQNIPIP